MTKDKALEELFLAQQPLFDDQADFMATLTRRLDAVEYVRQHQEATLRHYRMAMVAAFVVGLFGGGITLALVLSMPAGTPMFAIHVQSDILQLFVDNLRTLFAAILSFLMTLASIGIFSNVHNMMVLSKYNISAQDIV
ncbi:MAG: hypothetical protein J6I54_01840 [Bacteroidaceae bacterium]|nr:hypothetical protein [Bacteroidaceae bacterium]